jgi:hypothetical protein
VLNPSYGLPYTPSRYATFDTLQLVNDLTIPTGQWNTTSIPEPLTSTFPEFGSGGGTQAITTTPILGFRIAPVRTYLTMNTIQQIRDEYLIQTRELLHNYPDELRAFEELWASGKLREAYISAMKAVKHLGLVRSQENKKADESFFWTHMH